MAHVLGERRGRSGRLRARVARRSARIVHHAPPDRPGPDGSRTPGSRSGSKKDSFIVGFRSVIGSEAIFGHT